VKKALCAALPYAVFLLLVVVSWGRWIEPYVDSGRELMVSWRVLHGQHLYRDIQWYHGPLAPYLGAAVDWVAGRSLAGRVVLSALVALLHLEALRQLARRFLLPAAASLAVCLAVATAFFLRPGGWLFPFSLDTAIAVAAITAVLALLPSEARWRDGAIAACLLAALLSRLELGLVAMAAILWQTRREKRRWRMLAALPLEASGLVYLVLSLGQPLEKLVRDGWLALLRPAQAYRNVYRAYAGLDRPALRLAELALAVILVAIAGALLIAGAAVARRLRSRPAASAVQAGALVVLGLAGALSLRPPEEFARIFWLLPPLVRVVPPLIIAIGLGTVVLRWARRRDPLPGLPDAALLVAAFFSGRLLLAAGYVGPYDAFFLPLPLMITAVLTLRAARSASVVSGPALPRLAAGALVIFSIGRVVASWDDYRNRVWNRVDTPAGPIRLTEPVAATTSETLEDLARRLRKGGRLVGFPEGGFFNYVLDLSNPLPVDQFFPGHVETAAQEQELIRAIAAARLDAVLVANVIAVGEERPAFGQDYFVELDRFLRTRFEAVASYGPGAGPNARVGDPQFFTTIRVPAAASQPR
jgi:hypothetical protein